MGVRVGDCVVVVVRALEDSEVEGKSWASQQAT